MVCRIVGAKGWLRPARAWRRAQQFNIAIMAAVLFIVKNEKRTSQNFSAPRPGV
jgi:hypothetical protein